MGVRWMGRMIPSLQWPLAWRIFLAKGLTNERAGLLTALPIFKYIPSWFPGAAFQDEARRSRGMVASFSDFSFSMAKKKAEAGGLRPSFVSDMMGQEEAEESDAKETATGIYLAAGESTSSALKVFVLAMRLNIEVQDKVHAELDAVPHATTASDIVEGYYILQGTLVIFNILTMVNNEYSNPDRFDPTRYLTADGQQKPNAQQDSSKYFGFGGGVWRLKGYRVAEGLA
ncbi:cytochrome P450 [Pisolithus marmoratus]|nr:cytochrome P450 [Pisolithus marmoratus]